MRFCPEDGMYPCLAVVLACSSMSVCRSTRMPLLLTSCGSLAPRATRPAACASLPDVGDESASAGATGLLDRCHTEPSEVFKRMRTWPQSKVGAPCSSRKSCKIGCKGKHRGKGTDYGRVVAYRELAQERKSFTLKPYSWAKCRPSSSSSSS